MVVVYLTSNNVLSTFISKIEQKPFTFLLNSVIGNKTDKIICFISTKFFSYVSRTKTVLKNSPKISIIFVENKVIS